MEELARSQLRFDIDAIVRQVIARLPRLPQRQFMRFGPPANGMYTPIHGTTIYAEAAVRLINELRIPGNPHFTEIAATLRNYNLDANVGSQGENREGPPVSLHAYLIRIVVEYLNRCADQRLFDQAAFDAIFERFAGGFDRDGQRWIRRTPLRSFSIPDGEPQTLQIDDNIVIRRIANEEREEWANSGFSEMLGWMSLIAITHLLEISYERPRNESPLHPPDVTEDEVLFALRMTGMETAGFTITESRLDSVMAARHYANSRLNAPARAPSTLGAAERASFWIQWAGLLAMRNNQRVAFAVRRYNDAYGRTVPEDELVDYWTALEAIFSRRNESAAGIRERLARRIGCFLASAQPERAEIREEAFQSYRLRSRVVHGGPVVPVIAQDSAVPRRHLTEAFRRVVRDRSLPHYEELDREGIRTFG